MKGKRKQVACHFKIEKDTAQKLDQRIKRSGFASRTECKKYTLLDIMHQPDNKRISDKKTTERMTGKLLHSFPKKINQPPTRGVPSGKHPHPLQARAQLTQQPHQAAPPNQSCPPHDKSFPAQNGLQAFSGLHDT